MIIIQLTALRKHKFMRIVHHLKFIRLKLTGKGMQLGKVELVSSIPFQFAPIACPLGGDDRRYDQ